MSNLKMAILIMLDAHNGQIDKAGEPYFLHPLRVMMDSELRTEEERIVAVLHDVVEDKEDVDLEYISNLGFSDSVVQALDFLTKRTDEKSDYNKYIQRVVRGPLIARKVKRADLRHNMDLGRFKNPGPKDVKRAEKYKKALEYLLESFGKKEMED